MNESHATLAHRVSATHAGHSPAPCATPPRRGPLPKLLWADLLLLSLTRHIRHALTVAQIYNLLWPVRLNSPAGCQRWGCMNKLIPPSLSVFLRIPVWYVASSSIQILFDITYPSFPLSSLASCTRYQCWRSINLSKTTSTSCRPVVHLQKTASNFFPTKSVRKKNSVQHRQPSCDRFAFTTSSNDRRLVGEHVNNLWQPPKDNGRRWSLASRKQCRRQAWARWLSSPKMSLSPAPPWNILVKNQEVNCAIFSNFDCFDLQSKSVNNAANCFSLANKVLQIPYRGFAPGSHWGTYVSQVPWAIALLPKWKSWRHRH